MKLLEENAFITAKQMSEQMDISTRKVSRLIKALKESGKIVRVGSDRKRMSIQLLISDVEVA